MLTRLSQQERFAVAKYDNLVRTGDIEHLPIWADSFSMRVFARLHEGGEVIDVGCGTGRSISLLPHLGIEKYFGIDPSAESIKYCKETWPEHAFEVSEIRELGEKYPGRFSGFMLLAVLMLIPRDGILPALQSLRKCLSPGATGMISLPLGRAEKRSHTFADGTRTTLYLKSEITAALRHCGFSISEMFSPNNTNMFLIHAMAK